MQAMQQKMISRSLIIFLAGSFAESMGLPVVGQLGRR